MNSEDQMPDASDRTLPCGTPIASLVDAVADDTPLTPHAAACPYCQETLAGLRPGWTAVRQASGQPVETPPRLVPRVLARLRAEASAGTDRLEIPGDRGRLRIGPAVLVDLARRSAATVPGVRPRTGRFGGGRLTLQIAVRTDTPLPVVVPEVHRRVAEDLGRTLGVPAPPLDVHVADVWE